MVTKTRLVFSAVVLLAEVLCSAEKNLSFPVGIYFNPIREEPRAVTYGYEGVRIALEENGFDDVRYIKSFHPEELKDIRVLIISSVQRYPSAWDLNQVREQQRKFVETGGGLLLIHEAIGWRGVFKDNPVFQEIGRGVAYDGKTFAPVQVTPLVVVDKNHAITRNLPESFAMQYDCAPLKPGPKGRVLIKLADEAYVRGQKVKLDNLAALIVGEHGRGRVVLMGPLVGLARLPREMENPPQGGELQMLLNAVKWAAGLD
ncbi:MAG TPA: ThuA domain-containing protein [bacterium]|nr:ThuA domain-containing protein [bacterium]HOL66174.1 ThuA domain-containing protein [bacterium]HPP12331.1 ThuA domain-containing protein [bacterium]